MSASDYLIFRSYSIFQELNKLNKSLGYSLDSTPNDFNSLSGVSRSPKPFVIGLIVPDVDINYKAITTTVGTKVIYPSILASSSSNNDGVVRDMTPAMNALNNTFWVRFVAMCDRLKMKPEDLLPTLMSESRMNPSAANPVAKGLNQLHESSYKYVGMSDEVYSKYNTLSAEDQLPWIEQQYKNVMAVEKIVKWENPGQVYASNLSTVAARFTDPNHVIYDGHMKYRNSDGSIPKKDSPQWNAIKAAGDDPKKITAEMGYYDGNPSLDYGKKGSITTGDMITATDRMRSTEAYRIGVDKIKQVRNGQIVEEPPKPVDENVQNQATSGIMINDVSTDDEIDDPMLQVGRHIAIDKSLRAKTVDDQVNELKEQRDAAAKIPALELLISPTTFSRHYEHKVDYAKGRRRPIVSMWLEQPLKISGKGTTAAQYAMMASGEGGITSVNRIYSMSYENLMSLVYLYRNNGMTYTSGLGNSLNTGIPLIAMSVYIYYDGTMYIGSFDDFSVTDNAEKPYNLEYSFSFTCRYEIPVTSTSEKAIVGYGV